VPYAWQDIGEYLAISSRRSQRLNVLGIRYISSGQDARTTRVLSFNFVPHQIGKRCKSNIPRSPSKVTCNPTGKAALGLS